MIGQELAFEATGWRSWLYRFFGTLDVDELIWSWQYGRHFFPHLKASAPAKILDAGCGKGLWTFHLARRFPDCSILGTDLRPEVIAFCHSVKRAESLPNAEFRELEFTDFDFREEFDFVLSFNSLHYNYDRDVEILTRFSGALKPGGLLMLSVPVAAPLTGARGAVAESEGNKTTKYGIPVVLDEFRNHYYQEEISEKLAMSGFDVLENRSIVGIGGSLSKRLYSAGSNGFVTKPIVWPIAVGLGWLDAAVTPIAGGSFLLVLAQVS